MVALVFCRPALAQSGEPPTPAPVILTDEKEEYPLGLYLEILEDPRGELTIEEVASPAFDSRFTPSQVEVPNYGFTDSAYWVRLRLRNETRLTNQWLLEVGFPNMHYVDLYTPTPGGEGFSVKQTGVLRPPASRDIRLPRIVFNLIAPTQGQQTFYLRFLNGSSMTLPLTLWTPKAFLTASQLQRVLNGLLFGALLILLAYNMLLLVSFRERVYCYMVTLLASLIVFEVSNAGYMEILVIPQLYYLKMYYHGLSFALIFVSLVLFTDDFLEIKTQLPKFHKVNIAVLAGWGVLLLLTPLTDYNNVANLMLPWAFPSLVKIS